MTSTGTTGTTYWVRPGLDVWQGKLRIAGRDVVQATEDVTLPVYLMDLERIGEQVHALQGALTEVGLRHSVRLALKAQREPEVLRYLRSLRTPSAACNVGIDACSPGEVRWAMDHGWSPQEISVTGTNMSEDDFDSILELPVHVNVDLLSQLALVGRKSPGRRVGIRVNPRAGAAWDGGETLYSGSKPTKFGIYEEQLSEALEIASRYGLVISTVHMHVGDGFLSDELPGIERAVEAAARMTSFLQERGCPDDEFNTGGGLGVPLRGSDRPLDLRSWAAIMARHLGPLDVAIGTEPGNYLVKESAILVARIVTLERRLARTFVGLNVGWNVMSYHFLYGKPFDVVLCADPLAEPTELVTVSGNINEGDDLFAENYPFPAARAREGDVVAILGVGGYNQAMQSSHCLRPQAPAVHYGERL